MSLVDNPSTVASRYRDAIITKRLPIGATIVLDREAKELGISLKVLKQAMRILTTMGLVSWPTPDTVQVRALTTQTLQDLEYSLTRRRL